MSRIFCQIKRTLEHGFMRSVGVLMSGSALAQMLLILVLPLLTRLYTPDDFRDLAIYVAILGIVSVAACLRLDLAIALPERDKDAVNLLALALCASAITTAATLIVILVLAPQIPKSRGAFLLLCLLPLGVWLTSSFNALQWWFIRRKQFATVALTRVSQAGAGVGTQVGLSSLSAPVGLIVGHTIASGSGLFVLLRKFQKLELSLVKKVSLSRMRVVLSRYKNFPKYSAFETLFNAASVQAPILVIAAFKNDAEVGFLMLAMRVIQAPMGLIGSSVAQVYLSQAAEKHRRGELGTFTGQIIRGLMKSGIVPLLLLGLVAPFAASFVFGPQWVRTGELVAWMTPWFVMQYIGSPVSVVLQVTGHQRLALGLQLFGLCLRVALVFFAINFSSGRASEFFAVSGFIFYSFYFFLILRVAKIPLRSLIGKV